MPRKTFFLFFLSGALLPGAAGLPSDSALFSIETSGNDALRAGAYRQALQELGNAATPAGLLKRAIASVRSGDTAGALAALTAGPAGDTALAPFALEMTGDIIVKRQPELALDFYGRALQAGVPGRYRSRIFDKIYAIVGDDTDRVAQSFLWPDYSLWWNARRPPPPEPLCGVIDSCAAAGRWMEVDSLVVLSLSTLSDSVRCAVVKSLCCGPASGGRAADTALSAAALFLMAKTALECGKTGVAGRMAAASRTRPDFGAAVGEREFARFRGKLLFSDKQYEPAITALAGYVRRFGYESDIGMLIARAYKNLDNNEEAADWYDRFIARTPRYPGMAEVLWRRAWIEEERGKPRTAAVFYKKIFKYYPRSARAEESFIRHALSLYREEKYNDALRELAPFETKFREPALLPACRYWRAKCFLGLSRIDTARKQLSALAQEEPYNYYAERARDLLLLYGDSAGAALRIDTTADIERALRWLDSLVPPSGKSLSSDDSLNIRRGLFLAATGAAADAELFIEPVELSCPADLSLEFRIALFYRSLGAMTQASRSGRRLAWRIPPEFRASIPLPIYEVMYPFYYSDIVNGEAPRRRLDPALVLGVIRQESIFNPSIVSRAGAVGLMQIMPATGAEIARDLGEQFSVDTLYDPRANIRYGTFYLRKLLNQFSGNEVLAIAGYNGGPHNARAWYALSRDKDFDLFVEDIGFSETRNYVKKVLANYWFYRRLSRGGPFAPSR
ncbi:MAG: transglycosylase SLT domain-containing protein [Chitinispirillaceae bacterium]|nr:transglycosylase SLT domain-containing protein [Chitinispirillaceae bacterium]